MKVSPDLIIDESEIEERFIRSAGPGGQNVNKVATAVQLRFHIRLNRSLPADVRHRLMRLGGSRVTEDGVLVIEAKRHRTQGQNRRDARERLAELIERALHKPKPRIATKPSLSTQRRRLDSKSHHSRLKANRQRPNMDD